MKREFYLVDNLVPELKKKEELYNRRKRTITRNVIHEWYDDVYVKFSRTLSAIYLLNNYDINKLIS